MRLVFLASLLALALTATPRGGKASHTTKKVTLKS
jgi:hypothetical protein